jgi:hypothetical protein
MAVMSLRALFAIIIAIGLFVAPLAIRGGAAMAMAPSSGHAQMMKGDHCGKESSDTKNNNSDERACCIAMCMAIAPAPSAELQSHFPDASLEPRTQDQVGRSFLAELPTPPPRVS